MVATTEKGNVVLVTGGTGLVGKALEWVLDNETDSRFAKGSNEEDTKQVESLFDRYKPTQVIHLAAMVGGLYKNMSQTADFFRDNILINNNVIDTAHKYKVRKLVACLSTCIFPDDIKLPFDETAIHLGPPHPSNYGYAYAKRMVDIQCRLACATWTDAQVFASQEYYDCILTMVENGKQFVVKGTGKPLRQFIYSRDLARLMIWALREYPEVEPILLSVNVEDEISIADGAKAIAKAMNYGSELVFDTTQADGQFSKTASNKKLRTYLPDFKFTPFDQAIQETVEWFEKNYETARK